MQTASMTRIYKVENIIVTCAITYDWSHPIHVGVARGTRRDYVLYVALRGWLTRTVEVIESYLTPASHSFYCVEKTWVCTIFGLR